MIRLQRRTAQVALSLFLTGMLSSCFCNPASGPGPTPEQAAPTPGELAVTEISPEDAQRGTPTLSSPEGTAPAQTPERFIVRVPGSDTTPTPEATLGPVVPVPQVTPAPTLVPTPFTMGTAQPVTSTPTPAFPITPGPAPPRRPAAPGAGGGAAGGGAVATPAPPPTATPSGEANIELDASRASVSPGQPLSVIVVVNAGPSQPVRAAQVHLDFDASLLEVVGLASGGALPEELQSGFDNGLGRVDYAAGTLGDPLEVPFTLATVSFRALAPTGPGGTEITFAPPQPPRRTRVAAQAGVDVTGDLTPVQVVVR